MGRFSAGTVGENRKGRAQEGEVGRLSRSEVSGGEGGIRTHGPLRDNGFRDRPIRPLSHLSASELINHLFSAQGCLARSSEFSLAKENSKWTTLSPRYEARRLYQ